MAEWAMAHPWMTLILGCTAFWALVECARSITRAVALIITACSQAKAVAAAAADGVIKAEQDTEENEPLTFEELGSMNGEPVFVTARYMSPGIPDTQAWMIVHVIDEVDIWLVDMFGDKWAANDHRITEIRRRPKEEAET